MKGAIIGFGVIAEGHLSAYNSIDELEIVAVVDICEERQIIAQRLIPNVHTYFTFEEMYKAEKIDFIDVCTPPYCRFDYMYSGIDNGLHVIGEKPFLLNKEQYITLNNHAKKSGVILYPCHNYKFAPIVQQTKKIIDNSSFGAIINGHFKTLRVGHARGNTEWNKDWRRQIEFSGGGILQDHGPHSIYMACYFMKQWPIAVTCIDGTLMNTDYDTEDAVWLTLHYKNNVKIDIDLTWASSVRDTYYYIFGSNESIMIENDNVKHITYSGEQIESNITSEFNDPKHKSWFKAVLRDFYESIYDSNYKEHLVMESYITVATIEAAYQSAKQGGIKIEIPMILEDI